MRLDELDAGEARQLVRELEHAIDVLTRWRRAGDRPHELGHGEGRLLLGEAFATEHFCREVVGVDRVPRQPASMGERVELAAAEPVLGRTRFPASRVASAATREAANPLRSQRLHVLHQRLPPSREGLDRLLGNTDELTHPLDWLGPLDAEPAGELVAEVGFVQVPGGEPVGLQDRFPVERPPLALGGSRHVGDQDVHMEVRILRAARPVAERRGDEALAVLADVAGLAAADDARLPLEIAECGLPRSLVRLGEPPASAFPAVPATMRAGLVVLQAMCLWRLIPLTVGLTLRGQQ